MFVSMLSVCLCARCVCGEVVYVGACSSVVRVFVCRVHGVCVRRHVCVWCWWRVHGGVVCSGNSG